MRIAVICNDTRGGVQPYVALAQGLQRAGHDVRATAPSELAWLFAGAGIPVTLVGAAQEAARRAAAQIADQGAAAIRRTGRGPESHIRALAQEILDACAGADLLTGGIGGMIAGLAVAERLHVPFVETHLHPIGGVSAAYPGVLAPWVPASLGSPGRRFSHHLSERMLWTPFKPAMAAAREALGLHGAPRAAATQPVLYGFSRHVLDAPVRGDGRASVVTGYWTLPPAPDWSPPAGLESFLASDGPVVSIGFGSMGNADPEAATALVLGAVHDAGVRAVLLTGGRGLLPKTSTDRVFFAESVPHEWLLPRVTATVHHGGAGATGAALRAGVPAIVVPFGVDQPFWGARVAALGAGPPPIPRKSLTRQRLAAALRLAVTDAAMRERAARLGALIRAEDGVTVASRHFDRLAA